MRRFLKWGLARRPPCASNRSYQFTTARVAQQVRLLLPSANQATLHALSCIALAGLLKSRCVRRARKCLTGCSRNRSFPFIRLGRGTACIPTPLCRVSRACVILHRVALPKYTFWPEAAPPGYSGGQSEGSAPGARGAVDSADRTG